MTTPVGGSGSRGTQARAGAAGRVDRPRPPTRPVGEARSRPREPPPRPPRSQVRDRSRVARRSLDPDVPAALEEERDFLLRSLRDLEAEHDAGDVDDARLRRAQGRLHGPSRRPPIRAIEADDARSVAARHPSRSTGRRILAAALVVIFSVGAGVLVAQWSGTAQRRRHHHRRHPRRHPRRPAGRPARVGQRRSTWRPSRSTTRCCSGPGQHRGPGLPGLDVCASWPPAPAAAAHPAAGRGPASLQQALRTDPNDGTSLVFMAVLLRRPGPARQAAGRAGQGARRPAPQLHERHHRPVQGADAGPDGGRLATTDDRLSPPPNDTLADRRCQPARGSGPRGGAVAGRPGGPGRPRSPTPSPSGTDRGAARMPSVDQPVHHRWGSGRRGAQRRGRAARRAARRAPRRTGGALGQALVQLDLQAQLARPAAPPSGCSVRRARADAVDAPLAQQVGQRPAWAWPRSLSGRSASSPSQPDRLPAWAWRTRNTGMEARLLPVAGVTRRTRWPERCRVGRWSALVVGAPPSASTHWVGGAAVVPGPGWRPPGPRW